MNSAFSETIRAIGFAAAWSIFLFLFALLVRWLWRRGPSWSNFMPSRHRSTINPMLRYGLAGGAAWGSSVMATIIWGLDKGGIQMIGLLFFGTFCGAIVFGLCVLLTQLLRIPSLGRWWFGRRLPAVIAILLGHAIYFTVNWSAFNATPATRVYPSYDPITVSIIATALFTFGFLQFPFFRSASRFSSNPASAPA